MVGTEVDQMISQRRLCRFLLKHRSLSSAEFCMGYWPEGTGPMSFWEYRFKTTEADLAMRAAVGLNGALMDSMEDGREWPNAEVAYVVPFYSCPNDEEHAGVSGDHDAGSAFFDAAAILKHSICENSDENIDSSPSVFGYALYAIVHPDAVNCMGPNGVEYDRVKMLQSLGYWVKIWDVPVNINELENKEYLVENLQNDVGLRDLLKLHALRLEAEFVVLVDTTFHLTQALDPIYQMLRPSNFKAAYTLDPNTGGVSTSLLIMKSDQAFYDELVEIYRTVPFDETDGWGSTGTGLFPGGMGTSGLLSYYFEQNIGTGDLLDRCLFNNNADFECGDKPVSEIYGFTMTDSVCGQAWQCNYPKDSWDESTKSRCNEFFKSWMESRLDYSESHWSKTVETSADGVHYPEVYNGYCEGPGQVNYIHMLNTTEKELETCNTLIYQGCEAEDIPVYTFPDPDGGGFQINLPHITKIAGGAELEHNVAYPEQCAVYVAEPYGAGADVSLTGTAEIRGGPVLKDTSIVFVIDRSGTMCDIKTPHGLGCSSDENFDLHFDDQLDCEIAAVLDMVTKVRAEGTVAQIGLVSFSSESESNGIKASVVDLPMTDIEIPDGDTFHGIETSIREVECGGGSNYKAAVEKACSIIEQSTTPHNFVMFLSDGMPTHGGAIVQYCSNHAIFHTIALGIGVSCDSDYDTSLQSIATDTSGTCTTLDNASDLRETLKGFTDLHIESITGGVLPTAAKVNFGCADIPFWRNKFGMSCDVISASCAFLGGYEGLLGHMGTTACCACGGGESMHVGDLQTTQEDELNRAYNHTVKMPPGQHDVCTSVTGVSAGIPGVNEQCRKIYVCPNPLDGIPG